MQSPTSKSAVRRRRSASQGKQESCAASVTGAPAVMRVVVMLTK